MDVSALDRFNVHRIAQSTIPRTVISRTIAQHIEYVAHHSVSARTFRRRLKQIGLSARRPLLGLPLTQNQRRLRCQWCDERRMWVAEWNGFVLINESYICLQHHNGRIRVWRHRGERMLNSWVLHHHTDPAWGIMFTCRNCGGADRGRVAIYRPFGEVSLSLNRTVTCMVLKANDRRTSCPCHDEFRGPRSDYVRQAVFQEDNAPPHIAFGMQRALQSMDMSPGPVKSTVLSPI
ncbi:transposable element Tcb1 transposase [Trichonephila clavipes]|nr:transposable element Tcb1 transposase [Trichonephila clavipes]